MRGVRALAALALAIAGCASDETACEEPDSTDCLAVTASAASRAPDGWPAGTPGLLDVVLDVRAFDADAAIAGPDGRGVMVLARAAEPLDGEVVSASPAEAFALVFDNGGAQRYRLPAGRLELLGFGDRYLCRGGVFEIDPDAPTPEVLVTLRSDGAGTSQALIVDIQQPRAGPDAVPVAPVSATCRTEAAWDGTLDRWSTLPTVVIIAGLAVLIPLLAISGDSLVIITGFP